MNNLYYIWHNPINVLHNHFSTHSVSFKAAFYLSLCRVGAVVQLKEELSGPSTKQSGVSLKLREQLIRAGRPNPEKPSQIRRESGNAIKGYTLVLHSD